MTDEVKIIPLTEGLFDEAVSLVFDAELDTRQEIEHHLRHIPAHFVAMSGTQIVGVIGWYKDDVDYATEAMGDKFPGREAYWVGFFAVSEKFRGKGIGQRLLRKLEETVREKGADRLWVSSVPGTESYYARNGFMPVMEGTISGNKKFFMVKELS